MSRTTDTPAAWLAFGALIVITGLIAGGLLLANQAGAVETTIELAPCVTRCEIA